MNMSGNRPNVTDEEIGMRTFQLRKARAVERAMERLRQGLQADYAQLSHAEVEALNWIFGELWAYVSRGEWDDLHFSTLDLAGARSILDLARDMTTHERNSVDVLQDVRDVITATG
jgi:hypothetical protein